MTNAFEDFNLIMVKRMDLGAGAQQKGPVVVMRLPELRPDMELGERHQNVRTGSPGQWKRCGKVLGRVRSAEGQAHGPQARPAALGSCVVWLPLWRDVGQNAEGTCDSSSIFLDMRNRPLRKPFPVRSKLTRHSWCQATDGRIWGRQLGMWVDQCGTPSLC